ncbi:MAG: hypothetical protein V7L00_29050 [Nostoc sp.]|uniref:hypothetical protein n=1 Tax=Nostoc sp. TaxID=1180 RepID=UPI002FFBC7E5
MAKGFGKSPANKKLKVYAPLDKHSKSLILSMKMDAGFVYGRDFLLDKRAGKIYVCKKVTSYFNNIQASLNNSPDASAQEFLQKMSNALEETDNLETAEFFILSREATLWSAYKILHDGSEPLIENGLCVYPDEEFPALKQKADEITKDVMNSGSPDDLVDKYVTPFCAALKKQGYIYRIQGDYVD